MSTRKKPAAERLVRHLLARTRRPRARLRRLRLAQHLLALLLPQRRLHRLRLPTC